MVIEDSTLLLFKPWLLGYCNCGCGGIINIHKYKIIKFIPGHQAFGHKGIEHHNWKFGRYKNQGYWILTMPGYFSADVNGRIHEHVYNYQEFNRCCVCKWAVVHHIDGSRDNNMPWNLVAMSRKEHQSLHTKKDMSKRRCSICDSKKTQYDKRGWFVWFKDGKGGFECRQCHRNKKEKVYMNLIL